MTLLEAIKKHNEGKIALHKANIAVYLKNPAGIGEHSDIASRGMRTGKDCTFTRYYRHGG